jgi:hypothetical protein
MYLLILIRRYWSLAMRTFGSSLAAAFVVFTLTITGCTDDSSNAVAPYEAQRPLFFTRITQSANPDLQWLGGRIMAIGVNRGTKAALDGTLAWLRTGTADSMNSYVTFGKSTDLAHLQTFGGVLADSLDSDSTYTFWVATKAAYDARFDRTNPSVNRFTLAESTLVASYWLKGQAGGEGGTASPVYRIRIRRDQTVLADKYTIFWTPTTSAFRTVALRMGSTGGYDNLSWLVSISGTVDNILPPVVLGVPPGGVNEGTAYAQGSMVPGTVYTLWMTNRNWVGTFALNAKGYAFFRFTAPE